MISIPKDKQKHLMAGILVLGWAILLIVASLGLGISMPAAVAVAAGLSAAVTEEASQWLANRDAKARGEVPTRTVSALDILAGAAPCLAAAVVLELGWDRGIEVFAEILRWAA